MGYTGGSPWPLPQRCTHDNGRESAWEKFSFTISQQRDERWSLDKIRPIFSRLGCKPRRWAELEVGEGQHEGNSNTGGRERRETLLSGRALGSGGEGSQCLPSALEIWTGLLQLPQQPRVRPHASICSGNSGLQKPWIRRIRAFLSLGEGGSPWLYPQTFPLCR